MFLLAIADNLSGLLNNKSLTI